MSHEQSTCAHPPLKDQRPTPRLLNAAGDALPVNGSLDQRVETLLSRSHAPGISLATIRNREVTGVFAYGWADIERGVRMQPTSLLNIGSVTKLVTTTAVMQLWEQEAFSLCDDIAPYLPFEARNPNYRTTPITFLQLLTHTSSIRDGVAYRESYVCGDPSGTLGGWLCHVLSPAGDLNRGDSFGAYAPGVQYTYSNVGYGLLGYLVERISGTPFAHYCADKILGPLGMERSGFLLAEVDTARHARGYTWSHDGTMSELVDPAWTPPGDTTQGVLVPRCLYSFATPPDGLLRTSAIELGRFLAAFSNGGYLDGQRILATATVEMMLSSQIDLPARSAQPPGGITAPERQGLGWRSWRMANRRIWGHAGDDPGVTTLVVLEPERAVGVALIANIDAAEEQVLNLAAELMASMLDQEF